MTGLICCTRSEKMSSTPFRPEAIGTTLLSFRASIFAQKVGNTNEGMTDRKSPLERAHFLNALAKKRSERLAIKQGVCYTVAKNIYSSQKSHISQNLSTVATNFAQMRGNAKSKVTGQKVPSPKCSGFRKALNLRGDIGVCNH